MIDINIFEKVSESLKRNEPVALATITESVGSSPGKMGAMMAVFPDGTSVGTVGGGNLEYMVIKEAKEALEKGKSAEFFFELDDEGDLGMSCGGTVKVFIKALTSKRRLLIVGGGHIGQELYKLGLMQDFSIIVVDDRAEFASRVRFPEAEEVHSGDITEIINNLNVDKNFYVAIATRGHKCDEEALAAVAGSDAAYVGMIGSRAKVASIMERLSDKFSRETLSKVYAPMGLDIASVDTGEIAMSIMSEILLVKNQGSANHMRTLKGYDFSAS